MHYLDIYFEKISKYKDDDSIIIPTRATRDSAGYDFCSAEDVVIPSFQKLTNQIASKVPSGVLDWDTLQDIATSEKAKTTLIPTGIKCKLPEGYFLHLSLRSSCPNKHWLVIANAPGIVDADYYNNRNNEGHIFFQVINLLPFDIFMPKGTAFGQGIILPYAIDFNDNITTSRTGGFGSTSK